MRTLSFLISLMALAAVGCGSDADTKPAPRTVDPTTVPILAAVQSNASVALQLHSALREHPGNLFYSPLSIEAVLGMLYAGADGETAAQIGKVLDAVDDPHALHEGLGALLTDLAGDRKNRGYTLAVANRLWAAPGLDSSKDFLDTTRDLYAAPMEPANFEAEPEKVRVEINDWVAEQTREKIPELLKADQITRDTVLTVVNAIYFKAAWAKAFDPELTREAMFHREDGTDVSVRMMSTQSMKLRTAVVGETRWVELPYRGDDISFLAYTTDMGFGNAATPPTLKELEATLADIDLSEVVAMLGEGETTLQMPRFSLRSRLDLIPIFKSLGVLDLFDPSLANLSKIDAGGGLYVDPFLHEATVEVDEQGTVAAAATGAGIRALSRPVPIVFDHPFLFFIRDNLTGAILFTGRVADPTAD